MKKIMLVDDDVEFCKEMASLLQDNGYEVIIAKDGWSALAIARQGVDIILFDLRLPDLSGHYFINVIKTDEKIKKTPIFVISCLSDADNIRQGFVSGADEYFIKPLEIDRMLHKVEEYLTYGR